MPSNHYNRKRRGRGCVQELAQQLVNGKRTVVITGAGISVASGVRPFRGHDGIYSSELLKKCTRAAFIASPQTWYTQVWIPTFASSQHDMIKPNAGHDAIADIMQKCPHVSLVTQNIDGLHHASINKHEDRIMEAHGRLGWYKCIPIQTEEEDVDSDDDEEERSVHLGHRRHSRAKRLAYYKHHASMMGERDNTHKTDDYMDSESESEDATTSTKTQSIPCPYQQVYAISLEHVQPPSVRPALLGNGPLYTTPRCPSCHNPCAPLALLFDEPYHSHDSYRFEQIENLLEQAQVIVFVGTSFQGGVRLTQVALEHARTNGLHVYNFNIHDKVKHSSEFGCVQNVMGPAQETLPKLQHAVQELLNEEQQRMKKRRLLFKEEVVIYTHGNKRRRGKREKDRS